MQAVSIVFFTESWRPDSFYSRIASNRKQGLHTLCLLDIKVKEPTLESLARGKKVYEPARYMSIKTAIEQLLEVEEKLQVRISGCIALYIHRCFMIIVSSDAIVRLSFFVRLHLTKVVTAAECQDVSSISKRISWYIFLV